MNGWDQLVRPEKAIGAMFALTGLARAAMWWIDRDLAKRAVPKHEHDFRTARPGHWYE
jgi:hypothetical protein